MDFIIGKSDERRLNMEVFNEKVPRPPLMNNGLLEDLILFLSHP